MTPAMAIYQSHGWSAHTTLGGEHKIIDMTINLKANEFNNAYFQTDRYISPSTQVVIKWMQTIEVFRGNVITCRKLDTGPLKSSKYDIECEEVAAELQYRYVKSSTGKRSIWIKNSGDEVDRKMVKDYIGLLLPSSGYEDSSDWGFQTAKTVPSTGERIPDMGFSNITVATAIDKLLIDTMGYGVWYDYNVLTDSIRLRYGYYNHNIGTNWDTPVDSRIAQRGKYYGVDGIIVFGDEPDIIGMAGDIEGNIICFRYSGCNTKAEAMTVADQIFKIRQDINTRYELDFEVSAKSLNFKEGDIIDITDSRINMTSPTSEIEGIPNGFMIYDIKITIAKVTLGLSTGIQNMYDMIKSRLSIIDGERLSSMVSYIEFDWALITGASGSFGDDVEIPFMIDASTYMGDFELEAQFSQYGVDQTGIPISGDNVQLTQYADWDVTDGVTLQPGQSLSTTVTYYELPKIIKWGEINISYSFGPDSIIGGKASFDVSWGNGVIIGDSSDVPVYNPLSTITHRWYIQENWDWGPTATLWWEVTNTGTQDITLLDLLVKASVFYYVSAGGESSGSSGVLPDDIRVSIQLDDKNEKYPTVTLGPYTTDGSGDISESISKDIQEMIKYRPEFEIAGVVQKLIVAATQDVSVLFDGQCIAFDEDTTIIK